MKVVRCVHVGIPEGESECGELVPQERRIPREHSLLSEERIEGQFTEDLLVLVSVRMFQRRTRRLGKREEDVVRVV